MNKKNEVQFELPNSKKKFMEEIEDIVWDKDITHLDAVIWYCKEKGIEPEEVKRLVTPELRDKLELNYMDLNYLPKRGVLPI